MKARIIRMVVTPLLRITDDEDNDLCLVDGKPFLLYSGQQITMEQVRAQLLAEMTPELMKEISDKAKIDIPKENGPA